MASRKGRIVWDQKRSHAFQRDALLGLRASFPENFDKIHKLMIEEYRRDEKLHLPSGHYTEPTPDSVLWAVGSLVLDYQSQFRDSSYLAGIYACSAAAQKTAAQLEIVFKGLQELHPDATRSVEVMIAGLAERAGVKVKGFDFEVGHGFGRLSLLNEIRDLREKLLVCDLALGFVSGDPVELNGDKLVRRRGRPALPYRAPTLSLLHVWEAVTGARVSSPKGIAKSKPGNPEEAIQPSTEFVRLCLTMIDPKLNKDRSAAIAITMIKHALQINKELKGLVGEIHATVTNQTRQKALKVTAVIISAR